MFSKMIQIQTQSPSSNSNQQFQNLKHGNKLKPTTTKIEVRKIAKNMPHYFSEFNTLKITRFGENRRRMRKLKRAWNTEQIDGMLGFNIDFMRISSCF